MESLKAQEDACVLPTFDSDVAFALGTIIRTRCQRNRTRPAVVYIAHANSSQLLFFAASRPGTHPDDMHLVKRKEAVVLRWRMSTTRTRMQLARPTSSYQEGLDRNRHEIADPIVYAFLGGGFPVRVKNVEGIVGVIVVDGLNEEDNHGVIVDGIQEYLANPTTRNWYLSI
ncbi:hypothetical protein JVT61DRAFT_8919 [Boletus reticuloceps]|uniref:Uncharacterized protein n=1 Tax=Boletus reticuloceps TaxID=495285 RepID=A0A8I2YHB5_9AGAM|nr:hypothetical protein JVT61DRAFT_8919 [Boletus reticuloceps]